MRAVCLSVSLSVSLIWYYSFAIRPYSYFQLVDILLLATCLTRCNTVPYIIVYGKYHVCYISVACVSAIIPII